MHLPEAVPAKLGSSSSTLLSKLGPCGRNRLIRALWKDQPALASSKREPSRCQARIESLGSHNISSVSMQGLGGFLNRSDCRRMTVLGQLSFSKTCYLWRYASLNGSYYSAECLLRSYRSACRTVVHGCCHGIARVPCCQVAQQGNSKGAAVLISYSWSTRGGRLDAPFLFLIMIGWYHASIAYVPFPYPSEKGVSQYQFCRTSRCIVPIVLWFQPTDHMSCDINLQCISKSEIG